MIKTKEEILREGYSALIGTLGATDTIRFLQHFRSGQGDYTKERRQWLDNKSLMEVWEEMEQVSNEPK
jgi:hypothetical protein